MSNNKQLVGALDIGTSKTIVLIGEVQDDKEIHIIGFGQAPSHGLKAGMVTNIDATAQAITQAMEEAQLMADCQIGSVVTGIAGMNDMKAVGRVAGKAMLYFVTFSTLALIVGMVVANIIEPGHGLNIDPATLQSEKVSEYVAKAHESSFIGFLMNIIPTTVLSPLVEGNILQVLFVSILFGVALASVGDKAKPIVDLLHVSAAPMFKVVSILMKVAPLGALGAMAFTVGKYGLQSISNLMLLILTFYITSFLFVTIILGAVARYNGFSILKMIRYIKQELWLVLGTSSS